MAKERRNNSAVSALFGLLDTIDTVAAVELKDNPEALAAVKKMTADTKDSNFTTATEHLDDSIETKHQVDEVLEAGGINPVQQGRDGALAGAAVMVEMVNEEHVALEQVDEQVDEQEGIETAPKPSEE